MTYPTAAVNTANIDASGDSPALARSDILDAIQKLNQMIAHTTAFAATLLDDANAATARATLGAAESGANTDITSLAAPALGAATATTQAGTDNSAKVATTAQVQAAMAAYAIGIGQTWQQVTSSRALGGSGYTNNTGRPIMVSIVLSFGGTVGSGVGYANLRVAGQNIAYASGSAYDQGTLTAIIPDGATYIAQVPFATGNGTTALYQWYELR